MVCPFPNPINREVVMFSKKGDSRFRSVLQGVRFRTVATGRKMHLTEFRLAKGNVIPKHAHPHEQTGYLVSGRITFDIAGEIFEAEPGDGWNIASDVEHGVDILEDSVVIEVFTPLREDYLP